MYKCLKKWEIREKGKKELKKFVWKKIKLLSLQPLWKKSRSKKGISSLRNWKKNKSSTERDFRRVLLRAKEI